MGGPDGRRILESAGMLQNEIRSETVIALLLAIFSKLMLALFASYRES